MTTFRDDTPPALSEACRRKWSLLIHEYFFSVAPLHRDVKRGVETPKREPVELIDRVADAYVQATRLKAFAPVSFQVSNTRFSGWRVPRGTRRRLTSDC